MKRTAMNGFILAMLVIGFVIFFQGAFSPSKIRDFEALQRQFDPLTTPKVTTVTYTVEAGGAKKHYADVTYTNADGGMEEHFVTMPWTYSFRACGATYASIVATNHESVENPYGGVITVHIDVTDGADHALVTKQATSVGLYKIAAVSALIDGGRK